MMTLLSVPLLDDVADDITFSADDIAFGMTLHIAVTNIFAKHSVLVGYLVC